MEADDATVTSSTPYFPTHSDSTTQVLQESNKTTSFTTQTFTDPTFTTAPNISLPIKPKQLKSVSFEPKPVYSSAGIIWSVVGAFVVVVFTALFGIFVYRRMPKNKRSMPDLEMSDITSSPVKPTETFQALRIVNYVENSSSKTLKNSFSHSDPAIKEEAEK